MALREVTHCAVASLLIGVSAVAAQQCPSPKLADFGDHVVQGREYNLWLEVDHIARMPDAERADRIPHVYLDIFADLHKRFYALDNWMIFPSRLDGYGERKTPEQWLKLGSQPGYPNMFAQGIALGLFLRYPQQSQPMILQDIQSTNAEAVSRGLYVAAHMQESVLPDLFDDLQRISFSDGQCADEALRSLTTYSLRPADYFQLANTGKSFTPSSKALGLIPPLVPRFQKEPARYAETLSELLNYAPAPAALVADVDSKDANLRQYALSVLAESQDILPTADILKLAADRDPKVREWSIVLGFKKRRQDYSQLKPTLAKLLDDPDPQVRLTATKDFASRRDVICAPSLLRLLEALYRSDKSGDFYQLAPLADYVADQKFGFDSGTEPAPMQNERNAAALKRYASWVRSRN
jgi:hypothetical protein